MNQSLSLLYSCQIQDQLTAKRGSWKLCFSKAAPSSMLSAKPCIFCNRFLILLTVAPVKNRRGENAVSFCLSIAARHQRIAACRENVFGMQNIRCNGQAGTRPSDCKFCSSLQTDHFKAFEEIAGSVQFAGKTSHNTVMFAGKTSYDSGRSAGKVLLQHFFFEKADAKSHSAF
jgi:hypothetical protein